MTKFHTLTYNSIHTGSITVDAFENISVKDTLFKSYKIKGKLACIPEGDSISPSEYILRKCGEHIFSEKPKSLYIFPECKTPRDLYRKSGYQIVRDPEKADAVIIPQVNDPIAQFKFDIYAYDPRDASLYLYVFAACRSNTHTVLDDSIFCKVQDKLCSLGLTVFQTEFYSLNTCYIINNSEIFRSILNDDFIKDKRIYDEYAIELDPPIEINLDTLRIWENIDDYNLLAKAIVLSNWKQYPFTLTYFLSSKATGLGVYHNAGMREVFEGIHYDKYESFKSNNYGRVIQPEDWNLCQSYIMSCLGIPETGGFCKESSVKRTYFCTALIKSAYAVAPVKVNGPVLFDNIINNI